MIFKLLLPRYASRVGERNQSGYVGIVASATYLNMGDMSEFVASETYPQDGEYIRLVAFVTYPKMGNNLSRGTIPETS